MISQQPATAAQTTAAAHVQTEPIRCRGRRRRDLATWIVAAPTAGVAAAAASAPWEQRWMLPLAVAALVGLLHAAPWTRACVLGLLFGLGYTLTLTWWMRAVGTDAWVLIGLTVAGFYALAGMGIALVSRLRGWALWSACLWVATEAAMSAWPLGGFPWTRLAWATVDTPLAAWLPWIGVTGVSFLVALAGSVLAWGAMTLKVHPRSAVLLAIGALTFGAVPLVVRPESLTPAWVAGLPTVRVAVVQGDVPGAGNNVVGVHRQVTENHVQATVGLARDVQSGAAERPDFVLWPENSTAVDPFRDRIARSGVSRAVTAIQAPVVVGAIVDGDRPDAVLNQGIVWLPDGTTRERYTKRHPVPFGEYVPFRNQLAGLRIGRLAMIPRDMVAGTRTTPLEVAGARVADLICFDVAFDDSLTAQVRNGGQLVTVQTSNATFTGTAQLDQQFAISRLRAMETGRAVVIASTNGISGVFAPDGSVRTRLGTRVTAVALADVPLVDRQTPAVRYGELLAQTLVLMGLSALTVAGVAAIRGRRTRGRTSGAAQ